MSQIKETQLLSNKQIVYMVLYNYNYGDYSIIKIMTKMDDAYNYICDQHWATGECENEFQLIYISNHNEIDEKTKQECTNICYIPYEKYHKFNLCQGYTNFVSPYIIVPMKLD